LITEMLEIYMQTSYDQNVQLILKSYLLVVYGTPIKMPNIGSITLIVQKISPRLDNIEIYVPVKLFRYRW
jgi:hypothetical protein